MNREIKFRAWVANEMLYNNNATIFSHSNVPQISIMQYTGLKDKNGKEIYEGDIIYRRFVLMFRGTIESKSIIEWSEQNNGWSGLDNNWNNALNGYIRCEVIGNKYETPELLKTDI